MKKQQETLKCHLHHRLSAVACREGRRQGEKEVTFLAWRKITVKLSSGENTPGMLERIGGQGVRLASCWGS